MRPLVSVALHDREELLDRLFASLHLAGADFDLAVCFDGPTFDPAPWVGRIRDSWPEAVIDLRPEAGGHAVAINTSLRHRRPGQDFMTVDSDLEFLTEGWLAMMLRTLHSENIGAVSACILPEGARPFHGVEPGQGVVDVVHLPVGARLMRGEAVDRLGFLRVYGIYGCEDLDYDERMRAAGYRLVYDTRVVVRHPGTPSDSDWKRQRLEECLPCFKRMEQRYRAGQDLHEPEDGIAAPQSFRLASDLGLRLDATTDDYGSHLPMLRRAVEATTGPILELGCGIFSTPYLASTGREVVSVEANPKWLARMRERYARPHHRFVDAVPAEGTFAVALVDHEPDRRAPDIEALRGRVRIFVVHDVEPADPFGLGPLLATFPHVEFDRPEGKPWTAAASDEPLPWTRVARLKRR